MMVHEKDPVIITFKEELTRKLGHSLEGIILFGSQARGDGYPDSDYDMLVIAKGPMGELKNLVRDAEWLCMEKHNALVSSIIYTPDIWTLAQGTPLGLNIRREGKKVA